MNEHENGLHLDLIKSQCDHKGHWPGDQSIEQVVQQFFKKEDPVFAVFYLSSAIYFAAWKKDKFIFQSDPPMQWTQSVQLARVFSTTQELKIWRQEGVLHFRLRLDGTGEETAVVDAGQILWGTKCASLDGGWTRIWEDRGTELVLLLDISKLDAKNRVVLKTRNYLDFLPNGQATYVDSRFVQILCP